MRTAPKRRAISVHSLTKACMLTDCKAASGSPEALWVIGSRRHGRVARVQLCAQLYNILEIFPRLNVPSTQLLMKFSQAML